jgi:hypothetical protein
LSLAVPAAAKPGPNDLRVVAAAADSRAARSIELPVVGPIAVRLEQWGDEVRATVENRSAQRAEVHTRLDIPAPLAASPSEATFDLEPGASQTRGFALAGLARLTTIAHLVARTDTGITRPFLVAPPLLNGGFELDAGNDIAMYWHNYSPAKYEAAHLDRQVVAEGKQSLRLDPLNAPFRQVLNTYARLKPDTTYRLRAAIRRTDHSPGIWVGVFAYPESQRMAAVGQLERGTVDRWQTFEATFRTLPGTPHDHWYGVYCYNWSKDATAWFDAIRIEPVAADPRP